MTEKKDDTLEIDFVLSIVLREDWVDEEVLMSYELCFRIAKRMLTEAGEDITALQETRDKIMKLYGQI